MEQRKPFLYMAPIVGVTGCLYRNIYSKTFDGYDSAVMPFIASCEASRFKASYIRDILPERNSARFELVPQILSKHPKDFIVLAKAMFDLGYKDINWNLGCPFAKVRKKGRGSGLLSFPDEIISFLEEVLPVMDNQLSLKVRLGSENSHELLKILPRLNDFPLKEIIIHPRTGKQEYKGNVDLAVFQECLSLTRHTIVYNGDIHSLEIFNALEKQFSTIHRWMIGRGGITNPFLPEEIKGLPLSSGDERKKRFICFHNEIFSSYQKDLSGPAHVMDKMKELWFYWSKAFLLGEEVYLKISRVKSLDKYAAVTEAFFQKNDSLTI